MIAKFEEAVGNLDWVTSSDVVSIGKRARELTREFELDRRYAAGECFKLCLDMELGVDTAASRTCPARGDATSVGAGMADVAKKRASGACRLPSWTLWPVCGESARTRLPQAHPSEEIEVKGRAASRRDVITRLKRALREVHPDDTIDANGYLPSNWDNLLPGVRPEDFETDLRAGRGGELRKNFRAVHSSAALQVNAFAPFRQRIGDLRLLGMASFDSLVFERQCPAGVSGDIGPPHPDVLLRKPGGVVAVESKLKEYLEGRKRGDLFSPAYEEEIRDERRKSA